MSIRSSTIFKDFGTVAITALLQWNSSRFWCPILLTMSPNIRTLHGSHQFPWKNLGAQYVPNFCAQRSNFLCGNGAAKLVYDLKRFISFARFEAVYFLCTIRYGGNYWVIWKGWVSYQMVINCHLGRQDCFGIG